MSKNYLKSGLILGLSIALSACQKTSPPSSGASNPPSGSATLTWSAVPGETGYKIEQSSDGASFTQVKIVSGTATSATIGGLTVGSVYYFRVRSSDDWGDSAPSPVAQVTAG